MRSADSSGVRDAICDTALAHSLKSASTGSATSLKAGVATFGSPPSARASARTASRPASRAVLLETLCTSVSTNALYTMSSFVRWMSGVRVGEGVAVDTGAEQPARIARISASELVRRRRRSFVLRPPLCRRGAEPFVVDVFGDRRMLAARRALRVAAQLDLAERRVERVEQQVAADERLADPEQELQDLVRLDGP